MSSPIFAARLKDLLVFAIKTDSELAEETNLERKSIYNWLQGVTYPSAKSLLILADYFKVSIDYVLGLNDREEEQVGKEGLSVEDSQKILVGYLNGYMQEKGIKKYRLAKQLGIGQGTLTRWFQEGAMPETAILIKISTLLGKSLDELFGRK